MSPSKERMRVLRRGLQNLSFGRKLLFYGSCVSLFSLLLAMTAILLYDTATFRKNLVDRISSQADIVSQSCASAVVFKDAEAASKTLEALAIKQVVIAACVYDTEGVLFAQFKRPDVPYVFPSAPAAPSHAFREQGLDVFRSIGFGGKTVGMIHVRADPYELSFRFRRYVLITLIVLLVALATAALLSMPLRKVIVNPVLELRDAAEAVARGNDYTVRVKKSANDELGALADAFNQMIQRVQLREAERDDADAELIKRRDYLEVVVAERKLAEADLLESEMRFKALHNATFGGIAIHDQGIILVCNLGLSEITGHSVEELEGMNGLLLIAEPSRKVVTDNIASGYEKPYEVIGVRKNGEQYPVRLEARNIPYKGKDVRVTEFRDITEQRELESKLRQAQKMESIGRLAGGVAHDFNNVLMGMMGYVELCRDEVGSNPAVLEYLDAITEGAERSATITRQLLAFARKQIVQPQELDLNDAIDGMLNLLRRLIGEDIEMNWSPGSGTMTVKIDPSQIDQILVNLTVNARDSIGGVGKLSIETGAVVIDETYCAAHEGAVPGDYVSLTVSDSGCGMDKKTLDHIFEPFFTTKGVGKGTGMGLATVYGIAKQNNGFVYVYSELGQGATFKIYIPRHCVTAAAPSPVVEQGPPPRGTETVLIAEDEKSIRITSKAFLKALGYTVLAAEHPAQALRLVAEHSGKIHLLLADVIMPGMSGPDLAKQLLDQQPEMKCIFMSGFTADVIAQRGVLEKNMEFLSKPFGRVELARKVREVLDRVGS